MEWKITEKPVPYEKSLKFMEARVAAIREGLEGECIWCLEHPPLYTAGTSAKVADLFNPFGFPTYETGRGGEWTYHGPGQLVAYVMLDLKKHYAGTPDLRDFVKRLERWIIATLAEFGVEAFVREGRIGVWVEEDSVQRAKGNETSALCTLKTESKIAALGIRVRQGVSYHGIAININPELKHFTGIVPCGIKEFGVTSLAKMGKHVTFDDVITALKKNREILLEI